MRPPSPLTRYIDPVTWAAIEAILICAYGPDLDSFHPGLPLTTGDLTLDTYHLTPLALAALTEAVQGETDLDLTWPDQAAPPLELAVEDLVGPLWQAETSVTVDLALAERGMVIEELVHDTHPDAYLTLLVPRNPSPAEILVNNFPDPSLVSLIPISR